MKKKLQVSTAEYKKLSDEELLHRYAHRNEEAAINYLFDRYGHLVLGICMKYMKNAGAAKRATESLFLNLLDEAKRFNIDSFKPWLYNKVHTYCTLQTTNSVPIVNNTFVTVKDVFADNDLRKIDKDHLPELLQLAIKQINKDQRACLEAFYTEKMNYDAIATKTNLPVEKVRELIKAGKHELKIKLESLKFVNK